MLRTATEALQTVPKVLDLTAVGVGTTQSFTAKNLNSKVLVTLDNNIQSPVIQSPINVKLTFDAESETDFVTLTGISSFFSGDIIKINDEFMKIDTVGIGSTGTHYTLTSTGLGTQAIQTVENRFVPQQRIFIKDHKFFTGQRLVYNMGVGNTLTLLNGRRLVNSGTYQTELIGR